jgi:hypothetical protein
VGRSQASNKRLQNLLDVFVSAVFMYLVDRWDGLIKSPTVQNLDTALLKRAIVDLLVRGDRSI